MLYEKDFRPKNLIRAAIYARVSTKPQAGEDKISIPDQLRDCRKFATANNWEIIDEFIDPGITANTIDRPGLKKLLESSTAWDVVLAWDFDRFYRDKRSVAGYILDRLDELKKQITSVKQPIPIYEPSAYEPRENDTPYMLREMAGFTSGLDNRRRFRTLRKGLRERHRQGYMTKPPPYGYRVAYALDNGKPIPLPRQIDPIEGPVVQRMFAEYLSGKSFLHIALGLNRAGTLSRSGKPWSGNTIRGIIANPFYKGLLRVDFHDGKKEKPPSQWTLYQGRHESLIAEDDWEEAQALRIRKAKRARSYGSRTLLSGLLKCGYCGAGMCKEGSWGGGYYVCGKYHRTRECTLNSFRRVHLEMEVRDYITRIIKSEDIFENVRRSEQDNASQNAKRDLARLQKQLLDLPGRERRLFDLYETGHINKSDFVQRREQLGNLANNIGQSITEKERLLEDLRSLELTRDMFDGLRGKFDALWDSCDPAEIKQALSNLIEAITIKDKSFEVRFRVPELSYRTQPQSPKPQPIESAN